MVLPLANPLPRPRLGLRRPPRPPQISAIWSARRAKTRPPQKLPPHLCQKLMLTASERLRNRLKTPRRRRPRWKPRRSRELHYQCVYYRTKRKS